MRHFVSIYLKSQTHDDKRIQAPIRGRIKPEQRKEEINQTIKLLANNNFSVALRNGSCESVTLLIIP